MKYVVFCLGMLVAVWARADAETGWIIGTWVVDVERTVASLKPSSLVPRDSIEKYKTYLSTLLLTVGADTIHLAYPSDDVRPEIDIEYQYTVTGAVEQKVVLRGQLAPNQVERLVFDFESRDRCAFSLKFFQARSTGCEKGPSDRAWPGRPGSTFLIRVGAPRGALPPTSRTSSAECTPHSPKETGAVKPAHSKTIADEAAAEPLDAGVNYSPPQVAEP